jgi:molybdate transport system ATP-binding protein
LGVLRFDCQFRYATGFALQFAFTAEQGITALVGPSGSGKTTVLKLIAGLLRPVSGSIQLGERCLVDTAKSICLPPEQRAMGLVFQDYQLFPHLNVRQNLEYGLKRRAISNHTGRVQWQHVLEVLELAALLERHPHSLSGGEQQRVALGRAILSHPRMLLLDEPLSALDASLRNTVGSWLANVITEFQLPTLLVSHDPTPVESFAQQVLVMPNR